MSAEIPVEYACAPLPPGGAAVSDWQRPWACPHPVGPPSGKLTFLTKRRFSACAERLLTALSVMPASELWVIGPVAPGKNLLPTTPQAATIMRVNTGGALCAHADRSGIASRNGRPTAIVPTPRKNARRLTV